MGKEGDFSVAVTSGLLFTVCYKCGLEPHMVHSSIALICESKRQWKSKFGAVQRWPQKGQHLHCGQPRALERGPCFPQQPLTYSEQAS